jgi:hypothetical protein
VKHEAEYLRKHNRGAAENFLDRIKTARKDLGRFESYPPTKRFGLTG